MAYKKTLFVVFAVFILLSACIGTRTTDILPRSVPEGEGVSSDAILRFLEAAEKSKNEFHSFMFFASWQGDR